MHTQASGKLSSISIRQCPFHLIHILVLVLAIATTSSNGAAFHEPLSFAPVKPAEIWKHANPGTYVNDHGLTKRYEAIYHVPDNPLGLVYVFHPGGGSALRYTDNIEVTDLLNHLTHAGFAFIATDSALRNDNQDTIAPDLPGRRTAKWDKFPTTDDHSNRDFKRLLKMRTKLIDHNNDRGLTENTPLFAFGMSSGANFAYTFAHMAEQRSHVPDLSAIATYNGNFDPVSHPVVSEGVLIDTPTFIVTGENDKPAARLPNNAQIHQHLRDHGTPSIFRVNPEEDLNPDRFNRIPAVAHVPGLSDDLFKLFVQGDPVRGLPGFLKPTGERAFEDVNDANRILNSYTGSINHVLAANIPSSLVSDTRADIENQLKVNWAMHVTDARWAHQQTRFFLQQFDLPGDSASSIPEPGTLALITMGVTLLRFRR